MSRNHANNRAARFQNLSRRTDPSDLIVHPDAHSRLAGFSCARSAVAGKQEWEWYGQAAHLIVGYACRFHLATKVGNYLVSTVGEWWPERSSREIHAKVFDPRWLAENSARRGDDFDHAYMQRFGFMEIGCDRKYETMVFKAGKPCARQGCKCGVPEINGSEEDMAGYNDSLAAREGHLRMCKKWSRRGR